MQKKFVIASLLLIILLGGFLRFYKLGNSAFDRDEFFELNSSYGYFQTGNFIAWDFGNEAPFAANMQDDTSNERAEVFRWQLAQLYRFHEPTEFLTRGLGSAWGVIGIILVYFVAVSMTGNRYIGLIASLLTAIGGTEILYSRRLRMYAMFFPMYLLFSWTVFKFYESKYAGKINLFKKISDKIGFNAAYLIPVLLMGIITCNVHILTVNIAIAIVAYAGFFFLLNLFFKKKWLIDKYSITLALALFGFAAIHLPFLYGYYKSLKKNVSFFRSNYDFFLQYFSDFSYVIIGIVLMLFGAWFLSKKMQKNKEAVFLFLSAFVPLALAVFTWKREESHRYIYFLHSFGIILSAIGIFGIIRLACDKIKMPPKIIASVIGIIFLCSINFGYAFPQKSSTFTYDADSFYPDFRPVFDYVKKHRVQNDVMITRTYRSFYWRGEDIKVYDIKSRNFGRSGCENKIAEIVKENSSGWAVYPKVDKLNMCSAGLEYYKNNFVRVKDNSIPSSVFLYRWNNGT